MAGFCVHLGLLGPARRAGPPPLRSARKRRRGQGDVPPARGPPPSATGRYGPRGVFTHQAGARCTWGDVPPRLAARFYLQPGATARVASSLYKPVPAAPGGTCSPDRGPPLPATEHYGSRGAFHSSKLALASLGGTSPPGSRPASTRHRALRPVWHLHSSSRAVGAPYGGPAPVCVAGGRDPEVTARHIT